MYETLIYQLQEGIATITLNRPDRFNAFNNTLSAELQKALKEAAKDPAVRVVVLTGAGKAFCSGQDLKDIQGQTGTRNLGESVEKRYNPLIKAMHDMPKPIICRLNGVAAGAGCSLALACDMIIASEQASLIEVFVNVGLVLDSGSSYFLPRAVGMKRAFEMATMASKITAHEAHAMGLVNRVAPHDLLDDEVAIVSNYFAKAPTKTIGMIKKMLYQSSESNLDQMLQQESYCQEIAGYSKDYQEGVAAFVEKRRPTFKGE
ncbi:MAG: enoyl-CoA hydratase/isomerase family protein [Sphingobacteriales bacterium]|nr:enoyl-CoA hydratase/isomerase family protein [Sphingobacteriales bacterium]